MGITRIVSNTIKQIKMEEQGTRSILIIERNFDSIVRGQSGM